MNVQNPKCNYVFTHQSSILFFERARIRERERQKKMVSSTPLLSAQSNSHLAREEKRREVEKEHREEERDIEKDETYL